MPVSWQNFLSGEVQAPSNHEHEHVVHVVGDAARETPHRFHLARLLGLPLQLHMPCFGQMAFRDLLFEPLVGLREPTCSLLDLAFQGAVQLLGALSDPVEAPAERSKASSAKAT